MHRIKHTCVVGAYLSICKFLSVNNGGKDFSHTYKNPMYKETLCDNNIMAYWNESIRTIGEDNQCDDSNETTQDKLDDANKENVPLGSS